MNIPIKQHTILITGSAGYIGSRLRIRLDELGVKYIGVDRLDHKSKNSLCYDLSDKDQIIGTIRKYNPTYIVHCGTHSEAAYQNNFLKYNISFTIVKFTHFLYITFYFKIIERTILSLAF